MPHRNVCPLQSCSVQSEYGRCSTLEGLSAPVTRDHAPGRNEGQNLSCRKLTCKNFRKLLYMLMCLKYAVKPTGRPWDMRGQWEEWSGHFQHHLLHLETMLALALVFIDRSPTGEDKRGGILKKVSSKIVTHGKKPWFNTNIFHLEESQCTLEIWFAVKLQ